MMFDVVFAREELDCLLNYTDAMISKKPWLNPDWPEARWLRLREKLAEACRQSVAIQAGHDAYIARLHAADHEYERL